MDRLSYEGMDYTEEKNKNKKPHNDFSGELPGIYSDEEVNKKVNEYVENGRKDTKKYVDFIMRSKMVKECARYYSYDVIINLLVFEKFLLKYSPERATDNGFCGMFRRSFKNRSNGEFKRQNKQYERESVRLDAEYGEGENATALINTISSDERADENVELLAMVDIYADSIKTMLGKRKEGSTKRQWERLFATEFITQSTQDKDRLQKHIIENENRYISIVDIDFADSYLVNNCKTIRDTADSELYPMSVFGKESNEPCGYPLIGAVYAKYTGTSEPSVSQQRNNYRKILKSMGVLCK